MKKKLFVGIQSLLVATGLLFTVGAGQADAACMPSGWYVRLWEDNGGGDHSGSPRCDYPDFRNFPHAQAGLCAAIFKQADDWNNCVNAVTVALPCGWKVDFYDGYNFNQLLFSRQGNGDVLFIDIPSDKDDRMSSYRLTQNGLPCEW